MLCPALTQSHSVGTRREWGLCLVLSLLDPKIDKCTGTENTYDVFPYKKYQKAASALI